MLLDIPQQQGRSHHNHVSGTVGGCTTTPRRIQGPQRHLQQVISRCTTAINQVQPHDSAREGQQTTIWSNLCTLGNRTQGFGRVPQRTPRQALYPAIDITSRRTNPFCQETRWITSPLCRLSWTQQNYHQESVSAATHSRVIGPP